MDLEVAFADQQLAFRGPLDSLLFAAHWANGALAPVFHHVREELLGIRDIGLAVALWQALALDWPRERLNLRLDSFGRTTACTGRFGH